MLSPLEYSHFAISLFAVLGPIAAVPAFLSHTRGLTSTETSRTANIAACTATVVLVVAALVGQSILHVIGTSLGSLQIAGGLVMLLIAVSRLNPPERPDCTTADQGPAAGIVPLGFPLLAGPGSISSVLVAVRHGVGMAHTAVVIACVLAACATVWAVLRAAHAIANRLGRHGINAMSRLFAFLLAAIAVQIITGGLRSLFPILA